MIGYTCKYTPVELLAALGGQPALLNREANAFSHAEALTHNHFCCHAKAVLEECRRDGVRELVLVNCCDSIRRCYDVLRAQGGLDFLFLLDLPHHDDGCAKARLRGELERLAAEYGAYRGATLDEAALRAAFAPPVPLPDGPFLAVTGADLVSALGWCVLPFIVPDVCKGVLACVLGRLLAGRLAKAGVA